MNNRLTTVLVFLLALVLQAASASPNEQKEIRELYQRGLAGDKAAVNQCIEKLEHVVQSEPKNQIARVYLGSAYTLRSRDLGFGPQKLQALRHGCALMDEAVAAAPDNPAVRLARALTDTALPAIFGRGGSSRKDFAWLAQMARQHPERFSPDDLQTIRARE